MALVALQIHLHLKCYATGNKSSLHQELRNSGKFRVDAIKHREGFARHVRLPLTWCLCHISLIFWPACIPTEYQWWPLPRQQTRMFCVPLHMLSLPPGMCVLPMVSIWWAHPLRPGPSAFLWMPCSSYFSCCIISPKLSGVEQDKWGRLSSSPKCLACHLGVIQMMEGWQLALDDPLPNGLFTLMSSILFGVVEGWASPGTIKQTVCSWPLWHNSHRVTKHPM